MKGALSLFALAVTLLGFQAPAGGQGLITFYNNNLESVSGYTYRAGIFRSNGDAESGNSIVGAGKGFTAGLIRGTDFWNAPASNIIATTLFRTTSAQEVFATSQVVAIPGVKPGQTTQLSVAVWGTLECGPGVWPVSPRGWRTFSTQPLGGTNDDGVVFPVPTMGPGFSGFEFGPLESGLYVNYYPSFQTFNSTYLYYLKAESDWSSPGMFDNIPTGSHAPGIWTVVAENVDYVRGYWQDPPGGFGSVDLGGNPGQGAISAYVPAVKGFGDVIRFWLSGNPDQFSGEPSLKTVRVSADGQEQTYTYDTQAMGNSHLDMKWVQKEFIFYPTNYFISPTLTFSNMTGPGFAGPVIGGVELAYWVRDPLTITKIGPDSVAITFATCYQLLYQLQTRLSASDDWSDVGSVMIGDGNIHLVNQSTSGIASAMFRVKATSP